MMILKLLAIIFLALFISLVFRLIVGVFKILSFVRSGMQSKFNAGHTHHTNPQPNTQNTMVKYSTCNLYILDTEALSRNGVYFCSAEHVTNK